MKERPIIFSASLTPITVEAVAEVIDTDDGPDMRWLIEGGIAAMMPGDVLLIASEPITDDEGRGEVVRAALAEPAIDPVDEYRKGFLAGVDRAVNAMAQRRGCQVCGIGADGAAIGYVCPRGDCPTRFTCGGAV